MKRFLTGSLLALTGVLACAQSLAPAPGYTATEILQLNVSAYGFGGFSVNSGSAYYYQTSDFGGGTETRFRAASLDGASQTDLHDFNAIVSGGVSERIGNTVWMGDTADFTNYLVRGFDLGTQTLSTTGTVAGLYDLTTAPGGVAYVSYRPNGSGPNRVSKIDLATGSLDTVLDAGSDASGPLGFDAGGDLFYGSTTFGGDGNIRRFSAAAVAGALGGGADLTLSSGVLLHDLNGSQYLRVGMGGIYQTISPFGGQPSLSVYGTGGSGAVTLATGENGSFFSGLGVVGLSAYVALSDGAGTSIRVYKVDAVPEPSAAVLMVVAAAYPVLRRRRTR